MKTVGKKLLILLLVFTLGCTMLIAEAGEEPLEAESIEKAEKPEGNKYTPVFEISVPLMEDVIYTDTENKTHHLSIWHKRGLGDSKVKAGVAIQTLDTLRLTPMIVWDGKADHKLFAGLGGTAAFSKDFKLNFALGYAGDFFNKYSISGKKYYAIYSGMHTMLGVDYTLASAFLHFKLEDGFTYLADTGHKKDKKVNYDRINNDLTTNIVFNFFQFFMPQFEAGLYADFDLATEWERSELQDKDLKTVEKSDIIDLGLGIIMKPIDIVTLKTGFAGHFEVEQSKAAGESSYGDKEKYNRMGMLIGSELRFGKGALALNYTPYFSGKEKATAWENTVRHYIDLTLKYKY